MTGAQELEMGAVTQTNPVAMAVPAEAKPAETADVESAPASDAMRLRRALVVTAATVTALGLFLAYGSASMTRDAEAQTLETTTTCTYTSSTCEDDCVPQETYTCDGKTCIGSPSGNHCQKPCPGDTRGPAGSVRCNHDSTHRVCAKIGVDGTSFWSYTGQNSWCGKALYGHGQTSCYEYGVDYSPYVSSAATRMSQCETAAPTNEADGCGTWCICKWATARWIHGEWPDTTTNGGNCPDSIDVHCDSTDICSTAQGQYFSYHDYGVQLEPARKCIEDKCPNTWAKCHELNSATVGTGNIPTCHWGSANGVSTVTVTVNGVTSTITLNNHNGAKSAEVCPCFTSQTDCHNAGADHGDHISCAWNSGACAASP